ncbi:MAG: hypothetical protein AAF728_04650 [Cyanobacteria bacterium P01_D01_bin.128]
MAAPPQRPPLNTFRPTPENAAEFRRWYWLKAELVAYCKQDPTFQRQIAPQNRLAQYTRDFFADNSDKTRADLMRCWHRKKARPSPNGQVLYHRSDLDLPPI